MKFSPILLLVWLSLSSCASYFSDEAITTTQPVTKTSIFTPAAYSIPSITLTVTPTSFKNLDPTPSRTFTPTTTPTLILGLTPQSIKSYLVENVGVNGFGGKVSCAYQVLGTSGDSTETPKLYIWVLCQEYRNGTPLFKGTGMSLPVALYMRKAENGTSIASHKIPGSGTSYGVDIRAIFPDNTWDIIFGRNGTESNLRVQILQYEAESEAMDFYGLTTPGSIRPTFTSVR